MSSRSGGNSSPAADRMSTTTQASTPEVASMKDEALAQGDHEAQPEEGEEDDDDEDMGMKAKALTNLLKTSSVGKSNHDGNDGR